MTLPQNGGRGRPPSQAPSITFEPESLDEDLMGMMKQAKELQEKMQRLQEEVAALTIDGSSGGGLIKVTVNGKSELKTIKIDPRSSSRTRRRSSRT